MPRKKKDEGQLGLFPELSRGATDPHSMAGEIVEISAKLLRSVRDLLSMPIETAGEGERSLRTAADVTFKVDTMLQKRMEQEQGEDMARTRMLEELGRKLPPKLWAPCLEHLQEEGKRELKEVG